MLRILSLCQVCLSHALVLSRFLSLLFLSPSLVLIDLSNALVLCRSPFAPSTSYPSQLFDHLGIIFPYFTKINLEKVVERGKW